MNQELLLQNDYLAAEKETLAEIGKRLGRRALAEVARVETVLTEAIADRFELSSEGADYNPEQRAQALREWAKSHRPTPPLSDAAISREAL